ncbi:protein SPT2, partial [Lecanoromycetidae sp. Uapishka_2]
MSFLTSVLNSIGNDEVQTPKPPPQVIRQQPLETGHPKDRNLKGPAAPSAASPPNNKRKREDSLVDPVGKHIKNGIGGERSSQTPSMPAFQASKPISSSQSASAPEFKPAVPYRGTGRPNPAPGTSTLPVPPVVKAPKKGSYAEIMARAKAAEPKAATVGGISDKPKEKIGISYKKELKMRKKAAMNKKLGIKDDGKRPSSSGSMSSSPAPGAPERKKPPQPTYKGTAKPANTMKPARPQPTYKGTIKSGGTATQSSKPSNRNGGPSKLRYDEYAATDEDDLDDVDEDVYGSEESDDMEAGFSDVEQEETVAARAARKEDEEEARLEAKLKREKEDRRKRLEALSKKAKPTRY